MSKTKTVVLASRLSLRAGSAQAKLQADSTLWAKEELRHCWGPLTVNFWSREGTAIFLSDEFTAAVTVTGEGLCLKRSKKKKSAKIQPWTVGTFVTSFQKKLQISRCNSSAIFIMLSLKRYSERGLLKGFGFFLLFLMLITNFTWEI